MCIRDRACTLQGISGLNTTTLGSTAEDCWTHRSPWRTERSSTTAAYCSSITFARHYPCACSKVLVIHCYLHTPSSVTTLRSLPPLPVQICQSTTVMSKVTLQHLGNTHGSPWLALRRQQRRTDHHGAHEPAASTQQVSLCRLLHQSL